MIPLSANLIATVSLNLLTILGSCNHSYGGIILLIAKYIATVNPLADAIYGSCYNSLGGI